MVDSIFGWLNQPLSDGDSTAVDSALKTYYRARLANDLFNKATDRFLPDKTHSLQQQSAMLDIALKRKQLGYPMDDDDLEDALNEGGGFPVGGLAIGALGAGLGTLARPGLGKAAAKATKSIGQFFNRAVAHEAPRLPLYPGAQAANIGEHGARDITRLMGRVFHLRQP